LKSADLHHSETIASVIDHTLLKVDETTDEKVLKSAVDEMEKYRFRCLILPPNLVETVKSHYPDMRVGTVIAYPLGCELTTTKIFAIKEAAACGADEVDVVLDLFAIRAANFRKTASESQRIVEAAHKSNLIIKLIIETPILDPDRVRILARAIIPAGADYWKTSTGYGRNPTRLSMVKLLFELAPDDVKIKASGGIKTLEDLESALKQGASVIGTSSSAAIVEEAMKHVGTQHSNNL